jgi:hypothetical protein
LKKWKAMSGRRSGKWKAMSVFGTEEHFYIKVPTFLTHSSLIAHRFPLSTFHFPLLLPLIAHRSALLNCLPQ